MNASDRMPRRATLAGIAAAVLLACTAAGAAHADAPMWVVKDKDSTIYLFGTVHLLDPNIKWLTPRIEGALEEATELWEEVPMPASLEEAEAQQVPAMLQRALSPGRALSSLLTDKEKAELERALARTPNPEQIGKVLERMKPWFAVVNLGVSPLLNAGFDPGAGADIVLSKLAHERGEQVRGFETVEQQLDMFSGGTEQEQLAALRAFLAMSDEEFDSDIAAAVAAFRAWMNGDTALVEALIDRWRTGKDELRRKTMPYDVFVANRNENWAGQIEELLAGKGVAFVAVGAGHLVGPDSVQARLAARGIEAERY